MSEQDDIKMGTEQKKTNSKRMHQLFAQHQYQFQNIENRKLTIQSCKMRWIYSEKEYCLWGKSLGELQFGKMNLFLGIFTHNV